MGRFAKYHPNVYAKKEGGTIILAVVLLVPPAPCMSWRHCVSLWKQKCFVWASKRGHRKKNQWIGCIFNTFPEKLNPNVCSTFHGGLFPEPGRVAYTGLHEGCFYQVEQFQLWGHSGASDSQPVSKFSYLKNLPLTIQMRVLSCVVLVVCNFSYHKCRHGNICSDAMQHVKRQYKSLPSVIMSPLDATNASFIMCFIVFVSPFRDTASQYGKGRNISVSRLRFSANHNALDSWPIRARLASQNDELCKNVRVSERRSIEKQQLCTVCGKLLVFF